MQGQKHEVEQEKASIRDELVRLEQEKLELDTERYGLDNSLQAMEQTREKLLLELQSLRKEKTHLQETLGQVRDHWRGWMGEAGNARPPRGSFSYYCPCR